MKTVLSALVAVAVLATAAAPASATFKGDNTNRVWKEVEKNLPEAQTERHEERRGLRLPSVIQRGSTS